MYVSIKSVLLIAALVSFNTLAQTTGPLQPTTGPGGTEYICTPVQYGPFWATGHDADDAFRYFLYQCPTSLSKVSVGGSAAFFGAVKYGLTAAPMAVLFHGLDAVDPTAYSGWITHLVRKGYTVIWPQYQVVGVTALADFKTNAVTTIADAVSRLQGGVYIPPLTISTVPQMVYVGHSAGAATAVSVASLAVSGGVIPVPKGYFGSNPGFDTSPPSLAGIPSTFKMLLVVGDEDDLVCKGGATAIWNNTSQVTDRNFLVAYSDSHGSVGNRLVANHIFPTTAVVNAYDHFVVWKLSTALADCSIYSTNCDVALSSGGALQTYMGIWSDAIPVVPLGWFSSPSGVTLTCE